MKLKIKQNQIKLVFGNKSYNIKERVGLYMSKDEKFNYDIENLKKDLEIENMFITEDEVNLLKRYSNNEITMDEAINFIKESIEV